MGDPDLSASHEYGPDLSEESVMGLNPSILILMLDQDNTLKKDPAQIYKSLFI